MALKFFKLQNKQQFIGNFSLRSCQKIFKKTTYIIRHAKNDIHDVNNSCRIVNIPIYTYISKNVRPKALLYFNYRSHVSHILEN